MTCKTVDTGPYSTWKQFGQCCWTFSPTEQCLDMKSTLGACNHVNFIQPGRQLEGLFQAELIMNTEVRGNQILKTNLIKSHHTLDSVQGTLLLHSVIHTSWLDHGKLFCSSSMGFTCLKNRQTTKAQKKSTMLLQYSIQYKTCGLCPKYSPNRYTSLLHETCPVPLPLPNLPEKPRWDVAWKGQCPPPKHSWLAGGMRVRLKWKSKVKHWGKHGHCTCKAGDLVGFGPLAFVNFVVVAKNLIWHSTVDA